MKKNLSMVLIAILMCLPVRVSAQTYTDQQRVELIRVLQQLVVLLTQQLHLLLEQQQTALDIPAPRISSPVVSLPIQTQPTQESATLPQVKSLEMKQINFIRPSIGGDISLSMISLPQVQSVTLVSKDGKTLTGTVTVHNQYSDKSYNQTAVFQDSTTAISALNIFNITVVGVDGSEYKSEDWTGNSIFNFPLRCSEPQATC